LRRATIPQGQHQQPLRRERVFSKSICNSLAHHSSLWSFLCRPGHIACHSSSPPPSNRESSARAKRDCLLGWAIEGIRAASRFAALHKSRQSPRIPRPGRRSWMPICRFPYVSEISHPDTHPRRIQHSHTHQDAPDPQTRIQTNAPAKHTPSIPPAQPIRYRRPHPESPQIHAPV
jgi:hypothetical protein